MNVKMMKKIKKMRAKILIIFVLVSFIINLGVASAITTYLYLDPSRVVDSTLEPPDTFIVNINMDDVTNLYGFEFKLGYDTNVLEAQQVQIDFLNEPRFWITEGTWNQNDFVWVAATSLSPAGPVTGDGTLATIKFKVTGSGRSTLNLYDIKLRDNTVIRIDYSVRGGFFSNIPVTCNLSGTGTGIDGICYGECGAAPECSGAEPGKANTCCGDGAFGCYFTDITGMEKGVRDGRVDMRDVSMASKAFGSYPGHELWEASADINMDDHVNMRDISAVSKKFGTTCEVRVQPLGLIDSLVQFFRNFFGRFLLVMR
jgi:hypothetical protein